MQKVRTRIAPSPTGSPHIGTAYAALFNFVFARKNGGDFILRIEDTDRTRFVESSEREIIDALTWLGFEADESPVKKGKFGPYRQSERLDLYQKYAEELVKEERAYYCDCSAERLTKVRKDQQAKGEVPRYDRKCRSQPPKSNENCTIRLAVPLEGETRVSDLVRGEIKFENENIDDQVLVKSDGFPTYHLASVVDDHLMEITHVIRAEEWLTSTPKHVILYKAFEWEIPKFAHLPLLRNQDRSKISKRKNLPYRYTLLMTGLSYVADNIRSVLRWAAIITASLFGLWLTWLFIDYSYKLIFPPPPPGPDTAFGKIRQPFVYNSTISGDTYVLDTPGGVLPNPGDKVVVYALTPVQGEFSSLDSAKKVAKSAGLDSEPQKISENEWRWTASKNPNKSLKYNIVTHNFVYAYDWTADSKSLEGVFKTTEERITDKARDFLTDFKSLKEDLKEGESRLSFYKLVGSNRNKVGSFSEANAVLVELFRKPINESQMFVEANPELANVNVLISPATQAEKQLLELNFVYWEYQKDKSATYPPKTANQAFDDLKNGKAYIAIGNGISFQTVTINDVEISYFNPNSDQSTIQPVYVFSGKGFTIGNEEKEFVAYVGAISTEYQR